MNKEYKSDVSKVLHESIEGLFSIGLVDKKIMKEFDQSCLVPVKEYTAEDIRTLREREDISQAVLARVLNVTTNCISKYEQGERKARGAVLKLLSLIEKNGIQSIL